MKSFATIPEALEEIRKGKLLIVIDNPHRENEGDLYIPTDILTPKHVTAMIRYGGGLVCTAITKAQARRLALPLMVPLEENTEKTHVNFTVSVSAKKGVTTGVSAFDRAKTAEIMADPRSTKNNLARPGHMFGLVAEAGGLLKRDGHTEAAVDLARLAGLTPAGVLCEVVGENGAMARRAELVLLSKKLGIKMVLIRDIKRYLLKHPLPPLPEPPCVTRTAESKLRTAYGVFTIAVYESFADRREHMALFLGTLKKSPLVRIHSQCVTGDAFSSLQCDCGGQLAESMRLLQKAKGGVLLYLDQEGRGIGLANKIKAYALQEKGYDTVDANHALGLPTDARDYKVAADILKDLGVMSVRLLTNNPEKEKQLARHGIIIAARIPLERPPNKVNRAYLKTKKRKMGHQLRSV